MADENRDEVAQGCCGRGCDCSKHGENASGGNAGSDSPVAWGESVAKSAVAGMDAPKAEGVALAEELQVKDEDIDGFIEKCDKEGKNPLDVVKFIAEQNGIDLSSVPRGDSLKLRLYELLKGVVRRVLIGFVSYCADNFGIGVIQSIINSVESSCRDGGSVKPVNAPVRTETRIVRLVPVRIGCAFPW